MEDMENDELRFEMCLNCFNSCNHICGLGNINGNNWMLGG